MLCFHTKTMVCKRKDSDGPLLVFNHNYFVWLGVWHHGRLEICYSAIIGSYNAGHRVFAVCDTIAPLSHRLDNIYACIFTIIVGSQVLGIGCYLETM